MLPSAAGVTRTATALRAGCLLMGSRRLLATSLGLAPWAQRSFQWMGMKQTPGVIESSSLRKVVAWPKRLATATCWRSWGVYRSAASGCICRDGGGAGELVEDGGGIGE